MRRRPTLSLHWRGRRAIWILLAVALGAAGGCSNDEVLIPFVLYTPEGQDTFAGVTEIRTTFGDKEKRTSLGSSGDSFQIKLDLPSGQTGTVALEGLGPSGQVLCRGRSPQIVSVGSSDELTLYVAQLGTFGKSPATVPVAGRDVTVANYRVEDWDGVENDVKATLFLGGVSGDGTTLGQVYYYDSYFHATYDLTELPEPRSEMTALNIDGGYFLLFGGRDDTGAITDRLDILRPGDYAYEYTRDVDYGVADGARTAAPGATLGPYPSLLAAENLRIQNSFLVVGGEGPEGPRCDAVHLVARYDLTNYLWSVTGDSVPLSACRADHTATVTRLGDSQSQDATRVVLVFGGAEPGDPVAETIRMSPEQVDVSTVDWHLVTTPLPGAPGPMRFEHGAAVLGDGRILVVGGRTADGTPLADGVLYDPVTDGFTEIPDLLATARYGAAVFRVGDELVVAGGVGPDGGALGDAEVLDVSQDPPARLRATPLAVARSHATAFPMPTGTWGLFGGLDAAGKPVETIEIYTPSSAP